MSGGTPQPQVPPIDLDKGGRIPQVLNTYVGPSVGWVPTDYPTSIEFLIDGGGQTISTGFKGVLVIPFWLIINDWIIMSDVACSATIDIWKCPQANYPPTIANSITGSAIPTITSAVFAKSSVLTGWNTEINQGDVLGINVSSLTAGTPIRITFVIECVRILGRPG